MSWRAPDVSLEATAACASPTQFYQQNKNIWVMWEKTKQAGLVPVARKGKIGKGQGQIVGFSHMILKSLNVTRAKWAHHTCAGWKKHTYKAAWELLQCMKESQKSFYIFGAGGK